MVNLEPILQSSNFKKIEIRQVDYSAEEKSFLDSYAKVDEIVGCTDCRDCYDCSSCDNCASCCSTSNN